MSPDSEITTLSGCLGRVIWFALGPALLLICAVVIASSQPAAIPGVLDIVYGVLLASTVIARFVDRPPKEPVEEPEGTASSEYKAGLNSALRYIIILSGSGIMLWAAAHFAVKGLH
ncbi:MAG TPA: hypothetical protein VJC37_04110 [Planctomycetota bacterium]|nr:hypothetical protein [Planctomycetota bacterium]